MNRREHAILGEICGAELRMGAPEDEDSTFICDLPPGHVGPHVDKAGDLTKEPDAYSLEWTGDARNYDIAKGDAD